ncbi:UNVERIFIED_CONTAM: protein ARV 1 [Sesamum latifolium]|uniref:Protein ARV n=1 Tax=Sesamum latifolium TaxID=2727402 RepID=A0AAW2Y959_9LAMI
MDSCGTTSKEQGTTDFRCVQCGFPIKTLYIQYSPGNIRLMKCVWEFPSSVIFIIDIFVISSNIVALKGAEYGYG